MTAVHVRKAAAGDAEGIARVHVDTWRSAYAGIIAPAVLDALDADERAREWARRLAVVEERRQFVFVGVGGGDILGFVFGGPTYHPQYGYDAELYALYVLQDAHRQGIGRRLTHAFTAALVARRFRRMLVGVLEANTPARRFYAALGGEPLGAENLNIAGTNYRELFYAWSAPALRRLAEAAHADGPRSMPPPPNPSGTPDAS